MRFIGYKLKTERIIPHLSAHLFVNIILLKAMVGNVQKSGVAEFWAFLDALLWYFPFRVFYS